jgi:hypothetical protein
MNLKDIVAKVKDLATRADAQFRAEVDAIKAQVDGALTDALATVKDLTAKLEGAAITKADLETQIATLTAAASERNKEWLGFNDILTDACLNGKLLDLKLKDGATAEETRAAALGLPMADKFKAYQGALNAAFAKANLPNSTLPAAPATPPAQPAGAAGTMKREAFLKLQPREQLDAALKGVKLVD